MAPNPRLVATPITVARTVSTSTAVPSGPVACLPKSGFRVTEKSAFSFLRKRKYASARATMPYTAQAENPQWKKEYWKASRSASTEPTSGPGVDVAKWASGSAAPQKTRPIPIPAENSIAIHEARENVGLSPGFPRWMFPIGLIMKTMQTITMSATRSR